MTHIAPTVGRIVYFFASADDGIATTGAPLAAIITAVNDDGTINLAVFSQHASVSARLNVTLVQEGDETPATGHAEWMPYQLGQAAKTEEVTKASKKKAAPAAEEPAA